MTFGIIKFKFRNIVQNIIIILICLTLIFNLQEYASYLGLTAITNKVSIIYKIGKDLGFLLIIFIAIVGSIYSKKIPRITPPFYVLFLSIIGLSLLNGNLMLSVAGYRWILPIFLILAIYPYIDLDFIKNLTKVLYYLMIVQVTLQILQMFFMPPIAGTNFLGLSARNTGFFVYPGPTGLFANVCLCFFEAFKKFRFSTLLVIISVILSMSSTGAFILFTLLFFIKFYHKRYFKLLCLLLPFFLFFIFINLDTITGRSKGDTMISGGTRFEILLESITNATLISTQFGTATNTAVSMKLEDAFIADSTYISLITNFGFIGFSIILFMLILAIFYAFFKKKLDLILFLIVFGLGSISIITFEFFPINLLMPIIIAFYIKDSKLKPSFK